MDAQPGGKLSTWGTSVADSTTSVRYANALRSAPENYAPARHRRTASRASTERRGKYEMGPYVRNAN